MKNILISILLIMFFGFCNRKANEEFITLCKNSSNILQIDYLDWAHGISNIHQTIKGDTLFLDVQIALGKKQKTHLIKLSEKIKNIKIGSMNLEIQKVKNCTINIHANENLNGNVK